jgi:hypothetical protein
LALVCRFAANAKAITNASLVTTRAGSTEELELREFMKYKRAGPEAPAGSKS